MDVENQQRALEALRTLQSLLLGSAPDDDQALGSSERRSTLARTANRTLALNSRRRQLLGPDLASEPCWEVLLALYATWSQGGRISVTDLAHETGIPAATVVRWLSALVARKFVCRDADPSDGRRIWLSLTREAIARIEDVLTAQAFGDTVLAKTHRNAARAA